MFHEYPAGHSGTNEVPGGNRPPRPRGRHAAARPPAPDSARDGQISRAAGGLLAGWIVAGDRDQRGVFDDVAGPGLRANPPPADHLRAAAGEDRAGAGNDPRSRNRKRGGTGRRRRARKTARLSACGVLFSGRGKGNLFGLLRRARAPPGGGGNPRRGQCRQPWGRAAADARKSPGRCADGFWSSSRSARASWYPGKSNLLFELRGRYECNGNRRRISKPYPFRARVPGNRGAAAGRLRRPLHPLWNLHGRKSESGAGWFWPPAWWAEWLLSPWR